jgi:putative addiction module component (TIGR02574 family)
MVPLLKDSHDRSQRGSRGFTFGLDSGDERVAQDRVWRRCVCGAVHFRIERKAGIRRFCGYRSSMADLRQLCSLPVAERLELVEDLWDSIAEEPGELRLTASHLAELDRRIDRFEESPDQGTDWNTLKGRILESL